MQLDGLGLTALCLLLFTTTRVEPAACGSDVKKAYNTMPRGFKWIVLWPAFLRLWGPTIVRDLLRGRPGATWREVKATRGMDPWRDVVDWVGGLPFEVATPDAIFDFHRSRGLHSRALEDLRWRIGLQRVRVSPLRHARD